MFNQFVKVSIATMLAMYLANWLSAQNATARKFLKGSVVVSTGATGNNSSTVVSI